MLLEKRIAIKLKKPFVIKVARPTLEEITVDEVILQEPVISQHKLMSKCDFYFKKALLEIRKISSDESKDIKGNSESITEDKEKAFEKYINGESIPLDDEDLNAQINFINLLISSLSEKDMESFDDSMRSLLTTKTNSGGKAKERCVLLINDDLGLESSDFDKLGFLDYQRIRNLYCMVFFANLF